MKKYGCVIKDGNEYKLCADIVLANSLNEAEEMLSKDYDVVNVFVYKDNFKYDIDQHDGSIIL